VSGRVRIGVLASGAGSNLQALIDASNSPDYPAQIAAVISNRRDAGALERARAAGIPAVWISHRDKERAAVDRALVGALQEHGCAWVALAGFMRILSPVFLDAFPHRVLNIHPALLPAFPGMHAAKQALDAGVCITGATVHLVDAGMDTGPIVAQGGVPVRAGDTADTLQQRIRSIEHRLYPRVLQWAAEGRIHVQAGQLTVDVPDGQRWIWNDDG